jgi:hypothetical protein
MTFENPYMKAQSVEEIKQMEHDLFKETWVDGKLDPASEQYYNDQMLLFEEAFECLFPEEYDYHKRYNSRR